MLILILISTYIFIMYQWIVGGVKSLKLRKFYYIYNILCPFAVLYFFTLLLFFLNIIGAVIFPTEGFRNLANLYRVTNNVTIAVIFIFYILALTSYFVKEFRGTNLNMSDILCIKTAREVAGGYNYSLKFRFIAFFIINIFVSSIIYKLDGKIFLSMGYELFKVTGETIPMIIYILIYFIGEISLVFIAIIGIWFSLIPYFILKMKIINSFFDYSLMAGENEGYLYNFFSSIKFMNRKNNKKQQKEYINKLIDDNKNKYVDIKIDTKHNKYPHIIVIMNESFGSAHERIETNIKVTEYYDSLKNVSKGNLYVNTFGGGTANTEFEFLTKATVGSMRYPIMPYNIIKHNKYSIARYFKNFQYRTIAMHPYTKSNYNRDKIYKYFGFDEFLSFDDFLNKKYVRNFVSDESMYENVIEKFKEVKKNKEKAFLFGITMQNHSGYSEFEGEKVKAVDYNSEIINSYLSLMYISDKAIKTLIDYFDKEDERVILCFFGDHNASFESKFNKMIYDTNINYGGTNAYKTPVFIYDNRHKADIKIGNTSANFLSNDILKAANMPFDYIHEFMEELHKRVSFMNFHNSFLRECSDIKTKDLLKQYQFMNNEYLEL